MAESSDSRDAFDDPMDEGVAALFARDAEQAAQYRDLLDDHGIHAEIETDEQGQPAQTADGIAIRVPADDADEAIEVIEQYDQMDDLLDDEDDPIQFEQADDDYELAALTGEELDLDEIADEEDDLGF